VPPIAEADVHAQCRLAAQEAAKLCETLGHVVEEATGDFARALPFEELREAMGVIALAATRIRVEDGLMRLGRQLRDDDIEPITRWAFDAASELRATDLARSRTLLHRSSWLMARFQEAYDVILTPTLAQPPVLNGKLSLSRDDADELWRDHTAFSPFTPIANWTGQPAMSVPLHWTPDGLPVGVQFFGRFGDEATLFRLAGQLERAQPWADKRPPI